ncbi:hypothetical protein K1X76_03320 [bacterium]|nr:hypothetical protein [bacterium]
MTNFKQLLQILVNHQVNFILIGGLAAIAQGCSFVTADLDIVYEYSAENIKKLVQALKPLKIALRGMETENLPFIFDEDTFKNSRNLTLKTNLGDLDLLSEIPGFFSYNEIFNASDTLVLFDLQCRILSVEGLIKNKKATNRPKDLNHLAELEELLNIKK